jgi:putative transposase
MTASNESHHRRSMRLPGYDYALSGAYFITLCTQDRECVLHDPIVSGIISDVWHALPRRFPSIGLDEFVIMPNHCHLVLWLLPLVGATLTVAHPAVAHETANHTWRLPEPTAVNHVATLGDVIGSFKSLVFAVYLDWIKANEPARRARFWQRNYYEHVIRNETELYAIRRYIRENPLRWALDPDNPTNQPRHSMPADVQEYLEDIDRYR